jgi:ElaB/YqjD/DUF883 family membrane-anchored ribosome-binding protein
MARTTQTARDQLVDDFKKIIDDAEELLKVTANETGGKIGAVRERAEANLREARRKLNELEDDLVIQTRATARATNELVHKNPWQSIAIAGGIGLLIGMLSSRR